MLPDTRPRTPTGFDHLSANELSVVLSSARALQRAAAAGAPAPLLRGRKFALMSESADDDEARLFCRAATELGAHVAHIKPSVCCCDGGDPHHTAGMLGRLYDVVACEGMSRHDVTQLRSGAGVPVYDGVASAGHPTATLADLLDAQAPPEDRRCFVLQAVLLTSLA